MACGLLPRIPFFHKCRGKLRLEEGSVAIDLDFLNDGTLIVAEGNGLIKKVNIDLSKLMHKFEFEDVEKLPNLWGIAALPESYIGDFMTIGKRSANHHEINVGASIKLLLS